MNHSTPTQLSAEELAKWLAKDSSQIVLVDVRESSELAIAPFSFPALHFPLSKSKIWMQTFQMELLVDKSIVVFCHAGFRSWNFGVWLLEQDLGYKVWNLEGGIDAWSEKIDSNVPRY